MDHDRLHLNLNYSWPSIRMILHTHTYQQWRENIVRRWEKDGMRGSRKERTKKFIVAVGIQEGVFSFFNKINYFTLFMSMHCTLFLYKKIHIPNTQFCVFSFKRMLQKYVTKHFFFIFFLFFFFALWVLKKRVLVHFLNHNFYIVLKTKTIIL